MENRQRLDLIFKFLCIFATWTCVGVLVVLLTHIVIDGINAVDWQFLNSFPSRRPSRAGIKAAIWGSLWVIMLTGVFAIPLGIGTAIFLEEYMPKGRLLRILEINIGNLAGMPSIIYGLLGLTIFVRFLSFDRSILSGSLTLALLVLPVIIIASQGAIRAVPMSLREAGYALGAYRWQVVFLQVVPAAMPGIMTGVILAISRAIGETAPLIIVGAFSYVAFTPESVMDSFTALPIQIYNWAGRPQAAFHELAAGGIIVLLVTLLSMNLAAVTIRNKLQRYK